MLEFGRIMIFKRSKKLVGYVFFIAMLISVVVSSFFVFGRAVSAAVEETSTDYLKETASLYAGTFQVKLNDQLFMLESQARYFSDINMEDYNAVKALIITTKGIGEFKRIAVANSSGMTLNYEGKSSGNILMKDYFKKAMKGRSQISSNISIDEDGEEVLTLAVPIFQKEKVVGVITGTFSYSVLDNIFSVDTFGGEGYTLISDRAGKIIIGTKNPSRLCYIDNWYDFFHNNKALSAAHMSAIFSDIQSNRTGVFSFAVGNERRIVAYTPVGVNNWYVLSVLSSDYILSQQGRITKITILHIMVMLLVFMVFSGFVSWLVIKYARIERDNARYAINSETSQTLIFEYDYEKQLIEFTGNTASVFGENFKQLPISDFDKISSLIHESERNLLEELHEFVLDGGESYSSEVRLETRNGDYAWYRILGTVIMGQDKQPIKFIGSIVNVNKQVLREQELKTMAETDLLSGLLNKVCMERNVTRFISANKGSHFAAFFIIDLDNFKQVNDRLGHSYGDQAICDTANKLSLVFSEKDYIGRIGGDEFCVLLCLKNSVQNARSVAAEKAATLRNILANGYSNGEVTVHVTPSIGISLFPSQAVTFKTLFKMADIALYHVKNNGKNNFAFYDSTMKNVGESVYE